MLWVCACVGKRFNGGTQTRVTNKQVNFCHCSVLSSGSQAEPVGVLYEILDAVLSTTDHYLLYRYRLQHIRRVMKVSTHKPKRFSRDQGFYEAEDDDHSETTSIASTPARPRYSRQHSRRVRAFHTKRGCSLVIFSLLLCSIH